LLSAVGRARSENFESAPQDKRRMLVLTRKVQEQIVIPECNLTFTILEIRKGKVRVGVSAPPGVKVHRHEVWMRILEAETDSEPTAGAAV
jgi:carbon storage regulator